MVDLLLSLPGPVSGLVVVALAVAATLGWVAVLRRRLRSDPARGDGDVPGHFFEVLGGVYGIVLAFVLVAVWEDFGRAETRVEQETTQLGTMFRDARALPEPSRRGVHDALLGYVRSVVDDEWPAMAHGEGSPRTLAAYDRLWSAYYSLDPGDGRTAVFYQQSVDRLAQVGENRRGRILASRSAVPPVMWLLLLAGGVVVAGLACASVAEPAAHRAPLAAFAGVLAGVMFLTFALDRPFGAGITLSRRPLVELAAQWATPT